MTGFNHGLVGGLIGKYLPLPVALPVALASHFILDMLPHYGIPNHRRDLSKRWRIVFVADFFATLALAIIAIIHHGYAMFACGLVAVIPDFIWVGRVIRTRSFNLSQNKSRFTKWHAQIQHWERPWGIWIELPLAIVLFYFVIIKTWY